MTNIVYSIVFVCIFCVHDCLFFLYCDIEVPRVYVRDDVVAEFVSTFVFLDAKRLIGRRYDDPVVQSDMKHWPFTVINDSSRPKVQVEYKGETKTFYPEEVSSMVLTKMKEIAEAYLGKVGFCQILRDRNCIQTPSFVIWC